MAQRLEYYFVSIIQIREIKNGEYKSMLLNRGKKTGWYFRGDFKAISYILLFFNLHLFSVPYTYFIKLYNMSIQYFFQFILFLNIKESDNKSNSLKLKVDP